MMLEIREIFVSVFTSSVGGGGEPKAYSVEVERGFAMFPTREDAELFVWAKQLPIPGQLFIGLDELKEIAPGVVEKDGVMFFSNVE